MGIQHNLTIVAKGCFLAGTEIETPTGMVAIENLSAGDEVISYNEKTGEKEVSVIGDIDILQRDHYYDINNSIKATGEHPFYTNKGIVEVQNFDSTHRLIQDDGNEVMIGNFKRYEESVTVYNLLDVIPNNNYYANQFLVHNKGCFLEDTLIDTPKGKVKIQDLNVGDTVISLNESNGFKENSKIEQIDVLESTAHFIINGRVKATGEHPFYISVNGENVIRTVENLQPNDLLIRADGTVEPVTSITFNQKKETVYNLINVVPNNNYYAADYLVHNKGGGGCFLAGTRIRTEHGFISIEKVTSGQQIISRNETTGKDELAHVERLDKLKAPAHYVINANIKATAEHPFYTTEGIKTVQTLAVGDILRTHKGEQKITSIEYIEGEVDIYNLINVEPNHNYFANDFLVHNKGGGGRGGSSGGRSSASSGSTSKSTSKSTGKSPPTEANKSANKTSSRSTTSAATKPGSKVTAGGKEVQTSAKAPSKPASQAGIAGVDGYTPKFKNGYSAPAGSVVYYPQHSALDYLPWVYLFSQDSPSNDNAIIMQPDGKEVVAPPVQEGVDGLAVFNWIMLIVIIAAAIGGIIWGVNKWATRNEPKRSGYGYY